MIYLDHHAATPLGPGVAEAVARALGAGWANASSVHAAGRAARRELESARDVVARAVGAHAADVVLTGGGTEAVNLAVLGLAPGIERVVTTNVEHPSLARAVDVLEARGARVHRIAVLDGRAPDAGELGALADERTLVAFGWVNHETGTLLPARAWTEACAAAGARVAIDATQALGKVAIDVEALGASAVAVAGSKCGGPAGTGAVLVRRGAELAPLLFGGSQERGRRPGSLDVAALAGFGAACVALEERLASMTRVRALRDGLEEALVARGAAVNGGGGERVATVVDASFRGWKGDELVLALDLEGVCAASGAACSSGLAEPSPVVLAMYPDEPWRAHSALRLSLGPETTEADVRGAIEALDRVLARAPRTSSGL
jgi:cysteine desulfurase